MTYLNIDNENILPVVTELNILLADYHVYYQKLRNFHWNVIGDNFFELHHKFEDMYNDTKLKIDAIAERIITLKYHPISKLSDYIEVSKIKEASPLLTDKQMVTELVKDHKLLIEQFYKISYRANTAKDDGTVDLITGYLRDLEKTTWMLNAWLKDTKDTLDTSFVK